MLVTVDVFQSDFGVFRLSRATGNVLAELRQLSAEDGRKRAVKEARKDIERYEKALNIIATLAWQAGHVHPKEIFEDK